MQKIYYILLFLILSNSLFSQNNIVPNYDFEDTIKCVNSCRGPVDIYCKHWSSTINTVPSSSDYYNTNCYNIFYPYCKINFSAYSDFGFSGIGIYGSPISSYSKREYLLVELKEKLIKDKLYCIEAFTRPNPKGKYITSDIGFLFSDKMIYQDSIASVLDTFIPNYTNSTIINDTTKWTKITGSFKAKGGERFLIIGNFKNDNNTNYKYVNWGNGPCYYFFDDVKVYYCGPDTMPQTTDTLIIPNVFTPNGDGYNDIFKYKNQQQWDFETQIYNRWGELLFSEQNTNWDGYYKGRKVSAGVYFYKITAKAKETGEIRVYNGVVHVLY